MKSAEGDLARRVAERPRGGRLYRALLGGGGRRVPPPRQTRSGGATKARRLHQRVEVRVAHVASGLSTWAPVAAVRDALLAQESDLERRERDLELMIVGLDGGDLLHEKA